MLSVAIAALLAVALLCLTRRARLSRGQGGYVYVNQDGSVRTLSGHEESFLVQEFRYDDSPPSIKDSYRSVDSWGSQSGFIERQALPQGMAITAVHPEYDERKKILRIDPLGAIRAAGDKVEIDRAGSATCTASPLLTDKERIERLKEHFLTEQLRCERLARGNAVPDSNEPAGTGRSVPGSVLATQLMNHPISFQTQPSIPGEILVLRNFRVIGTIRSDASRGFRYFHRVANKDAHQLKDGDLEVLKKAVANKYATSEG